MKKNPKISSIIVYYLLKLSIILLILLGLIKLFLGIVTFIIESYDTLQFISIIVTIISGITSLFALIISIFSLRKNTISNILFINSINHAEKVKVYNSFLSLSKSLDNLLDKYKSSNNIQEIFDYPLDEIVIEVDVAKNILESNKFTFKEILFVRLTDYLKDVEKLIDTIKLKNCFLNILNILNILLNDSTILLEKIKSLVVTDINDIKKYKSFNFLDYGFNIFFKSLEKCYYKIKSKIKNKKKIKVNDVKDINDDKSKDKNNVNLTNNLEGNQKIITISRGGEKTEINLTKEEVNKIEDYLDKKENIIEDKKDQA